MDAAPAGRVDSLDLIRGIAVLGILAINIAGFAGPPAAVLTPDIPVPASHADKLAYAVTFVLFEGKMRGLFSLLFGASLALFIERSDAAGRHGELLQLRRLGWLVLFGALHYYLLWWGDILFAYGVIGIVALMMRELAPRSLVKVALALFVLWHLGGMIQGFPEIRADEAVRAGTASPAEHQAHARFLGEVAANATRDLAAYAGSIPQQTLGRLRDEPLRPLVMAVDGLGETLPYMLIGIVLFGNGFFSGSWSRRAMWLLAGGATLVGLALTFTLLAWAWPRGFPVRSMSPIVISWTGIPHLLMTLGYAAALVLAAPWLARSWPGRKLAQAGRMAFSNYIGTSLLMTAIFHGWGLGLAGQYGYAALMAFVMLGWIVMLAFSAAWLAFYRRGPLEWLWRSLTEARPLANSRIANTR